jgi:hypothetical protein
LFPYCLFFEFFEFFFFFDYVLSYFIISFDILIRFLLLICSR